MNYDVKIVDISLKLGIENSIIYQSLVGWVKCFFFTHAEEVGW